VARVFCFGMGVARVYAWRAPRGGASVDQSAAACLNGYVLRRCGKHRVCQQGSSNFERSSLLQNACKFQHFEHRPL